MMLLLSPPPCGVAMVTTQSLAEVARKEAERRRSIDEQGIPVKRIDTYGQPPSAPGGAISVFSVERSSAPKSPSTSKTEPRASLRSYQTRLQKLDRDIAQAEERLKLLRARSDAERWVPTKTAKGSRGSGTSSAQDSLHWQILEWEGKLAGLRRDRSDTFQAGRKAGYLPGELENRGIFR